MQKDIWLAVLAMTVYIVGGIGTFIGIGLIGFYRGRDLLGLGEGASLGYLFFAVGLALSILGVLLMRIFRNR